MNLKLKGKTQKGKNRVRENGEFWEVFEVREKVIFSPVVGNWASIAPQGKDRFDKASRWVNLKDDVDFEIIKL